MGMCQRGLGMSEIQTGLTNAAPASIGSGESLATRANSQVKVEKVEKAAQALENAGSRDLAENVISSYSDRTAELNSRVEMVNSKLAEMDRDFGLRIDDVLNRPVVSLVKRSTGEVVQQLPSEQFLNAAKNIQHLAGVLVSLKS